MYPHLKAPVQSRAFDLQARSRVLEEEEEVRRVRRVAFCRLIGGWDMFVGVYSALRVSKPNEVMEVTERVKKRMITL
jgi:hypothetical protein